MKWRSIMNCCQCQGIEELFSEQFVNLAADIQPADIVTLDRVICCYPNMERLVGLSSKRARKLYGLIYPRDIWWVKLGLAFQNFFFKLRRNPFRIFSHPAEAVEAVLDSNGLRRHFYRQNGVWQVAIYKRE